MTSAMGSPPASGTVLCQASCGVSCPEPQHRLSKSFGYVVRGYFSPPNTPIEAPVPLTKSFLHYSIAPRTLCLLMILEPNPSLCSCFVQSIKEPTRQLHHNALIRQAPCYPIQSGGIAFRLPFPAFALYQSNPLFLLLFFNYCNQVLY